MWIINLHISCACHLSWIGACTIHASFSASGWQADAELNFVSNPCSYVWLWACCRGSNVEDWVFDLSLNCDQHNSLKCCICCIIWLNWLSDTETDKIFARLCHWSYCCSQNQTSHSQLMSSFIYHSSMMCESASHSHHHNHNVRKCWSERSTHSQND